MIMQLRSAFFNLAATRLRTILAMLGIVIGTASVVAMVSVGKMATQQALAQFKSLGTDMLAISLSNSGEGGGNQSQPQKLDLTKALGIQTVSPSIQMLAPYTLLYSPMEYRGHSISGSLIGVTESLAQVLRIKIHRGRFISDWDKYQAYCVIGRGVYDKLKQQMNDPIGTQMRIGDNLFTIAGIIDKWPENSFFYQDINNSILIPIRTSFLMSKSATINNIVLRLSADADISAVEDKITRYINAVISGKRLFFRSARELIARMQAQQNIFTLLLGSIGSISLLVGGIGIMNIMLVTVLERRREIGIRMAIGARRASIQWMFLTESLLLSLVGGLLGIIVGMASSYFIAKFARWGFAVFYEPPLIGFTVSVLIGVFFGYYPARQASKLDPIQALQAL